MLIFHCEHCGHKLGAKESSRGRRLRCVNCGQPVVVRDESAPIEPTTEPEAVTYEPMASEPAASQPVRSDHFAPEQAASEQVAPEPAWNEPVLAEPVGQYGEYEPPAAPSHVYSTPANVADPYDQHGADGLQDAAAWARANAPKPAAPGSFSAPAPGPMTFKGPAKRPSRKWMAVPIGVAALVLVVVAIFVIHLRNSAETASNSAIPPSPAGPDSGVVGGDSTDADAPATKPWTPPAIVAHTPPSDVHLLPEELFAKASPSIGRVEKLDSRGEAVAFGTGFFVSDDGLLVTNYHVLDGASSARFVMDESRYFEIEGFAAVDREHDLVLVKVKTSEVPALKVWGGDPPRVGAQVFAIGNPEGLSNTLSDGRVSGLRQDPSGEVRMVQISVPISHGSSGGPLLTDGGLVVGVTSAGLNEGQNLNFAIPSRQVDRLIRSAGSVHRIADLGSSQTGTDATRAIYAALELTESGRPDDAVKLLQRVTKEQRETWLFWFAMGLAHVAQKNVETAEADFANVQRLQPEPAGPWEVIGAVYLDGNKPDRAADCFNSAIQRDPFAIPAYAGFAQAEIKLGKAADGAAACNKGLAKMGDSAALLVVLGQCYDAEKDTDSAVKTYRRAVESDPHDSRALLGLAAAYKTAGNVPNARETFKKVLDSDSDAGDPERRAARKGLAALGKSN